MPNRYIKESCRTSKNLQLLADFSERLMWRLLTTADDYGRFMACPSIVGATCFPLDKKLSEAKVKKALTNLVQHHLILIYTVGDRDYGQFCTFNEHQGEPRARKSKFPNHPELNQADRSVSANICTHVHASESCSLQPCSAPDTDTDTDTDLKSSSSLSSLSPNPNPEIKNGVLEDDFDQLWSAYPRKVGKQAARKSWEKVRPRPDIEIILRAIAQQRTWPQWMKDEGQYIPHFATWLNQHRWEDEVMAPPPKPRRKPTSLVEML